MSTKYIKRSRLCDPEVEGLLELFIRSGIAADAARTMGVTRKTVNNFYGALRHRIGQLAEDESPFRSARIEIHRDYYYERVKKRPVKRRKQRPREFTAVGIAFREGSVFTQATFGCRLNDLYKIARERADAVVINMPEGLHSYDCAASHSFHKWYFIKRPRMHRETGHLIFKETVSAFCRYASKRMTDANGLSQKGYILRLKELEYLFNRRHSDPCHLLLQELAQSPLQLQHVD